MTEFVPFRYEVLLYAGEGETVSGEAICSGAFSEVTGLEATTTPVSLKEGGRNWGQVQLAGPTTFAPITLRRGVTDRNDLWTWFDLTHRRSRYDLRLSGEIRVLATDDASRILLRWKLRKVLPVKFKGPDLSATAGQVAVEEMQLVHEGLTLESPVKGGE